LTAKHEHDTLKILFEKDIVMRKRINIFKTKKIEEIKRELGRAHMIIALLALVAIVLLIQGAVLLPDSNRALVVSAVVLLATTAVISLSIFFVILSQRKK
jgi:hypothetical protein